MRNLPQRSSPRRVQRQPQQPRQPKQIALSSSLSTNTEAVATLNSTVTDIKTTNVGLAQTLSDTKKSITDQLDNPLALRYKGITITPVAFFAFERSTVSAR